MCSAKAALVYGLTVRSSSLLFAADAWSRLKFSLPFFQLVYLRRRKGGIFTSGSEVAGPVSRVPDEVWEQIRHLLIQEELVDSEVKLLEPLLCTEKDCDIKASTRAGISWESLKDNDWCFTCEERGIGEFIQSSITSYDPLPLSIIKSLLSDFGLALPTHEPIRIGPEPGDDPEALVLIGAPTHLENGSSETAEIIAHCGGDFAHDESTIIEASFKLPRGINTRFERLIKLFDLEVVDSSINKLFPRPNSTATDKNSGRETGEAQTSGVKNRMTKTIKPRWKLWTMCEYTW